MIITEHKRICVFLLHYSFSSSHCFFPSMTVWELEVWGNHSLLEPAHNCRLPTISCSSAFTLTGHPFKLCSRSFSRGSVTMNNLCKVFRLQTETCWLFRILVSKISSKSLCSIFATSRKIWVTYPTTVSKEKGGREVESVSSSVADTYAGWLALLE